MDSQGSSRRSSACSVPDVDTCGLEEDQVCILYIISSCGLPYKKYYWPCFI